ncbi:MAG: quinone-dependent dihydroorotate dehydrogenase [Patescibacteria group bacterium]
MSVIYDKILKPIFFAFDPEVMHHFFNKVGEGLGRFGFTRAIVRMSCRPVDDEILHTEIAGIKLNNPLGVGAGFDKEGRIIHTLDAIGFGFAEVGTITGQASPGNKKPRLWRLPEDRALAVNYGLLSTGADAVKERFANYKRNSPWPIPVGISVAKSNLPNLSGQTGLDDLLSAYQKLEQFASYITVNVSCPNTGDGEQYCKDPIMYRELLSMLDAQHPTKPIFFKLSPDLSQDRYLEIMHDTDRYAWAKGFITSNLTHDRTDLKSKNLSQATTGGVSGPYLRKLSDEVLAFMYRNGRQRYQFIGLGGIDSVEDAYRKILLGASAIQLVTSLIYNGPLWPSQLLRGLASRLREDGFKNIKEAVGVDNK